MFSGIEFFWGPPRWTVFHGGVRRGVPAAAARREFIPVGSTATSGRHGWSRCRDVSGTVHDPVVASRGKPCVVPS